MQISHNNFASTLPEKYPWSLHGIWMKLNSSEYQYTLFFNLRTVIVRHTTKETEKLLVLRFALLHCWPHSLSPVLQELSIPMRYLNGANVSEVKGVLKKNNDMIRGWKFQSLPCRIFPKKIAQRVPKIWCQTLRWQALGVAMALTNGQIEWTGVLVISRLLVASSTTTNRTTVSGEMEIDEGNKFGKEWYEWIRRDFQFTRTRQLLEKGESKEARLFVYRSGAAALPGSRMSEQISHDISIYLLWCCITMYHL